MAYKYSIRNGMIASLAVIAIVGFVIRWVTSGWEFLTLSPRQTWHQIWTWMSSPTSVPNWIFYGLILLSFGFFVVTPLAMGIAMHRDGKELKSAERDLLGVRWRWWELHGKKYDLAAFCPDCDQRIFPRSIQLNQDPENSPVVYHCVKCQRNWYESTAPHAQVLEMVVARI